jgi:hypothetical protein
MSFLYQRFRTIGSAATGWHVACNYLWVARREERG